MKDENGALFIESVGEADCNARRLEAGISI